MARRFTCRFALATIVLSGFSLTAGASGDLVAYWPFGANGLADKSGNGHDLVAGTDVAIGDYVTFHGTREGNGNSFLKTKDNLDLSSLQAMTIDFWMRMPSDGEWSQQIIEHSQNYNGTPGSFLFWYIAGSDDIFQFGEKVGSTEYAVTDTPKRQQLPDRFGWHHVALVFPKGPYSGFKIYIDGIDRSNAHSATMGRADTSAQDFANDTLYIGGRAGIGYFSGDLGKLRIFNSAFNADEVALAFMSGRGDGTPIITECSNPALGRFLTLNPAVGTDTDHVPGEEVSFSAKETVRDVVVSGWNLMTNAFGTAEWLPWMSGSGLAGSFKCPDVAAVKLVWTVVSASPVVLSADARQVGPRAVSVVGNVYIDEDFARDGAVSLFLEYRSPIGETQTVSLGSYEQSGQVQTTLSDLTPSIGYEGRLIARRNEEIVGSSYPFRFAASPVVSTIASWPFGASGLADVSGNGYGLLVGENAGLEDGVLRMRGTEQGDATAFVKSEKELVLSGASSLTIDLWVKYESSRFDWVHQLFDNSASYDLSGAITLYYNLNNEKQNWTFQQGEKVNDFYMVVQSSANPLAGAEGAWHHLTAVYPKGPYASTKLYVDGVDDSHSYRSNTDQSSQGVQFANGTFYLGGRGGVAKFNGEMDDVSIVAGTKTAREVFADHARQKAARTGFSACGELDVTKTADCLSDGFLPAPGVNFGFMPGDSVCATAPERPFRDEKRSKTCHVTGWTLSTNVVGTSQWVKWMSGDGTSASFTYPNSAVKIKWKVSGGSGLVLLLK